MKYNDEVSPSSVYSHACASIGANKSRIVLLTSRWSFIWEVRRDAGCPESGGQREGCPKLAPL